MFVLLAHFFKSVLGEWLDYCDISGGRIYAERKRI